jgi:colicin import membrane protein
MEEYLRKHKRGIIGTIIFHIMILLLLIFLGFFTPLPLPGEEGILVNFGTSDNGSGDIEPSPARNNPTPVKPVQKEEKKEVPPPPPTQPKTSQPKATKEVAMTQDYEKTAAVEAAEAKKKEEDKKRQEQLAEQRRQQQLENERKKAEDAESIRKQQEEAERIRKEEEARKAREEQDRKINEINSRVQGALSNNNGSGTGGVGNGNGKSQGATFPSGNQGAPTGSANAGGYGPGGSGSGNQGTGPSFSLSGRSATNLPRPNYPGDDGIVVVKITVDKYGKVTAAEPGVRGTTIMNQRFWNEAKQAALKASFNSDDKAPAFQQGTITYRFVLD